MYDRIYWECRSAFITYRTHTFRDQGSSSGEKFTCHEAATEYENSCYSSATNESASDCIFYKKPDIGSLNEPRYTYRALFLEDTMSSPYSSYRH